MSNLLKFAKLNCLIISSTLCIFTLSTIPVCQVHAIPALEGINLNDIAFAIRIEKLIGKVNKYAEKLDSYKLIDILLDIKHEVEGYTGKKIDLKKELDRVEKEVNKMGGKFKKGEIKSIHNMIKNKEKKYNHKALYIADCMEFYLEYSAEDEQILFHAKHGYENEEEEMEIPLRITVGVIKALCGEFFIVIPMQLCQVWAPRLITNGCEMAFEGTTNRM